MKTEEDMILNDEVELPYMRRELVISLRALSDPEYQRAIWVRREFPHENFYDDMYCTLNIIYDDSDLATDSQRYIGQILKDKKEMHALDKVVTSIDTFFQKYNGEITDEECLDKPEWRNVLTSAKEAYELIREQSPTAS